MNFAFEDLTVYQRATGFSSSIINTIDELETSRKHYRLIEQLESSCTLIALNIAEGKSRYSKREFKQFLFIARGSLYETVTMLQIFMKKELN
jgi:four helix bundle protein